MSPRQRRIARFAAAGVALLAIGLALWLAVGRASASAEGDWVEVKRDDLVIGVPFSGVLTSVQAVRIGPPQIKDVWDYKIAFMAPEGMQVRPGQPVLGFDTSELERELLDKMAERDSAQKELEKRQTNLEMNLRATELELAEAEARHRRAALKVDVPAELTAAKELAQAREDLELATREVAHLKEKIRLEKAQAATEIQALVNRRDRAAGRVREMQDAIQRMTVTAPKAGTVVYVSGRGDEKKKVGDSAWRGNSVLEIPDLNHMRVQGEVDESDAGRVAVGQPVTLRLDAHPDESFTGRVRTIGGAVQTKSQFNPLKIVKLVVELDRTDPQLMRPGMRVFGTIEIGRAAKTLVIPAEAVFNRLDGPVVYRRSGWGVEEVKPVLGRRNDKLVEIKSGLSAGDKVSRLDLAEETR